MKDRFQNISRGLTLALGLGVAVSAVGCAPADLSYRDRSSKITVSTKNGEAYCYSDTEPETRVYDREDETGLVIRWWHLKQNNFACDNAKAIDPTYKTGETIKDLVIGSSWHVEPELERLK